MSDVKWSRCLNINFIFSVKYFTFLQNRHIYLWTQTAAAQTVDPKRAAKWILTVVVMAVNERRYLKVDHPKRPLHPSDCAHDATTLYYPDRPSSLSATAQSVWVSIHCRKRWLSVIVFIDWELIVLFHLLSGGKTPPLTEASLPPTSVSSHQSATDHSDRGCCTVFWSGTLAPGAHVDVLWP